MASDAVNTETIKQGEFAISDRPGKIFRTILGSCVATCIYDNIAGIGGMNHFLLPGAQDSQDSQSGNLRYGINSMELLINGILNHGASRDNLKAKLFGGAKMIEGSQNVGQSNVEFARWFLDNEAIPCVSSHTGGTQGRKIRFEPSSGLAQQMLIESNDATIVEPTQPPVLPRPGPDDDDVTFF